LFPFLSNSSLSLNRWRLHQLVSLTVEFYYNVVQLSRVNSSMAEKVAISVKDQDMIRETLVDRMQQETVQLSQMDTVVEDSNLPHRTPVMKEKTDDVNLSQTDNRTPTTTCVKSEVPKKKKKRRNKEQRQKRLLMFQEKLVQTSGLPPSRLMEKKRVKLDFIKRNLHDEFSNLGSSALPTLAVPQPTTPLAPPTPPPSNGTTSSTPIIPMLCSTTTPHWLGGCTGGVTSSPGWPEARPLGGFDCNLGQPSHLFCGSTSGAFNQPSLSSTPQYVSTQVFQSQPPPTAPPPLPTLPGGRPAYCFHCLQYGSVFTITPA
jgi:hypothetical protein